MNVKKFQGKKKDACEKKKKNLNFRTPLFENVCFKFGI